MKKFLPHSVALFPLGIFLIIKLSTLGIRLSDTNVYFYTAYQILNGEMLYRDIFFTNFPLFPYISSIYMLISGNSVLMYYFSSAIEGGLTSLLIYSALYLQTKQRVPAISGQVLYLFSFMLLATTDHQSGVFLASLFASLSYLFFLKNREVAVGIFTAFTLLTKAYFLPLAVAYFGYFVMKRKWNNLIKYFMSAGITGLIILLPFLLLARNELISNVFEYSLTRGAGIDKLGVIRFFASHDTVIFITIIASLFLFKRYLFFALFSVASIMFIILYKDIYYLYLNFLLPILVVSAIIYGEKLQKALSLQRMVLPTIVFILAAVNVMRYFMGDFHQLQKVDISPIVQEIKEKNPPYLYGPNDITPLLAFKTNTPLLHNITDTNTNLYRKGILDVKSLTNDAIELNAMIVTHGAFYPLYKVQEPIIDEIFISERVTDECALSGSIFIKSEGVANQLNLFDCH